MAETKSKMNVLAILFYTLFIFLSLGQIARIAFFDQTIAVFPHEIVMLVIAVYLIYCHSGNPPAGGASRIDSGQARMTEGAKSLFLFVGALLLTFLLSIFRFTPVQNAFAFLYLSRLVFYLFFFVLLKFVDKKILRTSFIIFTVLTIIFSVGQYFLYPNLRNLYYLGWDPHQFRLFGTMFDTTVMGVLLAILFFWTTAETTIAYKKIIQTALILLLLLTYSRIAYLSLLLGGMYYFGNKKTIPIIITSIFIFIGVLFILPRPQGESANLARLFSIQARVNDNAEGLQIFLKDPIIGIGYNHIKYILNISNSMFPNHALSNYSSSFMTILVATGVAGFVFFSYFIVNLFKRSNKLGRTALVVVLCASFFDNVILQNFVLLMTLAIVAYSSTIRKDKIT